MHFSEVYSIVLREVLACPWMECMVATLLCMAFLCVRSTIRQYDLLALACFPPKMFG